MIMSKKDKNKESVPTPKSLAWGFTILELIVVIVIVGILAALALPGYNKTKEKQYDKEAVANLKLIMAAEKVYRMEIGAYMAPTTNMDYINRDLRLALSTGTNKLWDYEVVTGIANDTCIKAKRAGGGTTTWWLKPSYSNGDPINSDTATTCP